MKGRAEVGEMLQIGASPTATRSPGEPWCSRCEMSAADMLAIHLQARARAGESRPDARYWPWMNFSACSTALWNESLRREIAGSSVTVLPAISVYPVSPGGRSTQMPPYGGR